MLARSIVLKLNGFLAINLIVFPSCYSLVPFEAAAGGEMVSRRRILSRSRDDLTQAFAAPVEEEEDVWYQKDKLYKVSQ